MIGFEISCWKRQESGDVIEKDLIEKRVLFFRQDRTSLVIYLLPLGSGTVF